MTRRFLALALAAASSGCWALAYDPFADGSGCGEWLECKSDALAVDHRFLGNTWQRRGATEAMTYAAAEEYCAGLTLEGRRWRLPYDSDLEEILDPAWHPMASPEVFPDIVPDWYWAGPLDGQAVSFDTGESADLDPSTQHHVRCIIDE